MQRPKSDPARIEDISRYFLSAAEADVSQNATRAAGHLSSQRAQADSERNPSSQKSTSQPVARRRENCASCAHLITRSGQPFQCRIFSVEYARYKVKQREKIDLNEGRSCPYFTRVTSTQIEDILRSHSSFLDQQQVREYAHAVDEEVILNKTITLSPTGGISAEELLREELLRYLEEGYSIIEATVTRREDASHHKHSKTTTHKVRLRIKQDG